MLRPDAIHHCLDFLVLSSDGLRLGSNCQKGIYCALIELANLPCRDHAKTMHRVDLPGDLDIGNQACGSLANGRRHYGVNGLFFSASRWAVIRSMVWICNHGYSAGSV